MAINSYRTKKGEVRYRATFWHHNLPASSKVFERKVDAHEWLHSEKLRIENSQANNLTKQAITLDDFFNNVFRSNSSVRLVTLQGYCKAYVKHIKRVFGKRQMADVSVTEWTELKRKLVDRDKLSNATANRVHAAISSMYHFAKKLGYVSINPLNNVDWYREEIHSFKYWSREEVGQFLFWINQNEPNWLPFYQFLYETGLRISEVIGLKRDCVDLVNRIVTVRRAYCRAAKDVLCTTKSGSQRTLGLNGDLVALLSRHLATHKSEYVFCNGEGQHRLYEYFKQNFARHQKTAEVRRINLHDVRHTFASHYVMNGGNIYDLKALMGHSGVETTMRYAHLAPAHLHAKAQLVSFQMPRTDNVVQFRG